MKKKLLVLSIISFIFLTGCFNINLNKNNNIVETDYGIYKIDGLVKREDHSTKDKVFYCLEKDKDSVRPDNISVEKGKNYYGKDNHISFKNAIQQQIYMQVGKDAQVKGTGLTTSKGNFVYKFIITKKYEKTEITQYYIVGDYKYILVYETNFSRNPDLDIATYNIVDSFEWK